MYMKALIKQREKIGKMKHLSRESIDKDSVCCAVLCSLSIVTLAHLSLFLSPLA